MIENNILYIERFNNFSKYYAMLVRIIELTYLTTIVTQE
jgi:hypothetical protein